MKTSEKKARIAIRIAFGLVIVLQLVSLIMPPVSQINILICLGLGLVLSSLFPGKIGLLVNFTMLLVCSTYTNNLLCKIIWFDFLCFLFFNSNDYVPDKKGRLLPCFMSFLILIIFCCLNQLIAIKDFQIFSRVIYIFIAIGCSIAYLETWKEAMLETSSDTELAHGYKY